MFINGWDKNNGTALFTLGWVDSQAVIEFLIGLATEFNFAISVDGEIVPIYAPGRDTDAFMRARKVKILTTNRIGRGRKKLR